MIKKLSRSIRQYKKQSILTPIFVVCESILEILIPMFMAKLIDFGIDAGNMSYIMKLGLILLVAAILALVFGTLAGKFAAHASTGFAKNLRQDMYYNVQNFSFSNIDKFSTSSIITRLTTDVTNLQNSYMMIIRMAVRCPVMLIFAFSASMLLSAKLSLVFLCCVPVLAVGLIVIVSKAHPRFRRVFKTYDKLNGVVQENLRGIRVVKSFIREDYEEKKFGDISEKIYTDFSKAEKTIAFNMPLMQICIYFCMILISWIGAKLIVSCGNTPGAAGGLTTGELMSFFTYVTQILMSLMLVGMVFVQIVMSKASAERIIEILDEKSDIKNPENPVMSVPNGAITFENVKFSYARKSDKPVLDNINISISSGETVGIIGGTGSSKSSFVQLIPRLYDVIEGKVTVGGTDVRNYDIEVLRDQVAVVLQKNVLFSGTIKDNLRWGNENATDEEMIRACRLSCADEFISKFPQGYDTHIEQGGTNVSGGQKQRICIARALLKKPKIIILDDSTSAVDTKTDSLIRKAFVEEIPDTTKIIIAQRVASVQDADKIIVLDDGKINAVGKHQELLENCEIYREVYQTQIKGGGKDE